MLCIFQMFRLYQSFALWVDESRLHDSNLYLGSLPEVYKCDLLVKIFNGNKVDMYIKFKQCIIYSFYRGIFMCSYISNTAQQDILLL